MKTLRFLLFLVMLAPAGSFAQDWPRFRGPDGQGRAEVRGLPVAWSEGADNIVWKAPIAGRGWSSPVVQDGRVWLTTSTEDGRSLRAVCLDAATGREMHNVEVFHQDAPGAVHSKNNHASPTPVADGQRVFVHFGAFGTACLSREGDVLWRRKLDYKQVHGPGGSPLLVGDLLIVNCDGGDAAFVVALDAATGEERWRAERPQYDGNTFAFSTPLAIDVSGATQVVSAGAGGVLGYEPTTGRALWQFDYPGGYSVVPAPAFGHGLAFICTGYERPSLLAIRVGGAGNVTETHLAWKADRNAPHNPSPLLVGDELYMVSDRGVAACLDAKTGKQHWQIRLGGNFSASPVHGDGKIYFLNEEGVTTVISPGVEYNELAVNSLPGRTLATPALLDGALYLRTDTHCYRIGEAASGE